MALSVDGALAAAVNCVYSELAIPPCTVGITVGTPVIDTCCECEPGHNGALWGNLIDVAPGEMVSGGERARRNPCAPVFWWATYRVTLFRCFPTIDERGELPAPDTLTEVAESLHLDAAAMTRALHCCNAGGEPILLGSVNVTSDPSGGCSMLSAAFKVRVDISKQPAR